MKNKRIALQAIVCDIIRINLLTFKKVYTMKKLTFFLLLLLVPILAFSQGDSFKSDEAETMYVRKNANSPGGQADLAAMNKAFDIMRNSKDCDEGRSWYYQGAIHNIPSTINGPNQLCDSYQTSADKKYAWGDCTHTRQPASSLNFLLWHRIYTWHLESIVRELSGKTDFALPYWNYGSPPGSPDNILAALVIDPESSLFTHARKTTLNNGDPIDPTSLTHITEGISDLQTIDVFDGSLGFSKQLEVNPHNFMHGYMGGNGEQFYNEIYQTDNTAGLMGNVPSAGFDPGFWLHHAMIDRIWYKWDKANGGSVRPSLQQLKDNPWTYEFIDYKGGKISYTMEQVYNMVYDLNYTYDNIEDDAIVAMAQVQRKKVSKKSKKMKQQDPKEVFIWEQKFMKTIGKEPFIHKLSRKNSRKIEGAFTAKEKSRKVLRLNVLVYKEPADYYSVYLRYGNEEEKYVGVMTFFGVTHEHGEEGEDGHAIAEEGANVSFAYDVTDEVIDTDKSFDVIFRKHGIGDVNVTLASMTLSKLIDR